MIRPIAPTHAEAADKADRIKEAELTLKAHRKHTTTENVVYGIVFMIVVTGCLLAGKLLAWLVQHI